MWKRAAGSDKTPIDVAPDFPQLSAFAATPLTTHHSPLTTYHFEFALPYKLRLYLLTDVNI